MSPNATQAGGTGLTSSGDVALGGVGVRGPHALRQFLAPVITVRTLLLMWGALVAPVVLQSKGLLKYLKSVFLLGEHWPENKFYDGTESTANIV